MYNFNKELSMDSPKKFTIVINAYALSDNAYMNQYDFKYDDLNAIKKLIVDGYDVVLINNSNTGVLDFLKNTTYITDYIFRNHNIKDSQFKIFKPENELFLYLKLAELNSNDNVCIYVGGRIDDLYPLQNRCTVGYAKNKLINYWTKYLKADVHDIIPLDDDYPIASLKEILNSYDIKPLLYQ